jgi:hypothetical protein
LCKEVQKHKEEVLSGNTSFVEKYLPTKSGFFFGSLKYEDDYFEDIDSTILKIQEINEDLNDNETLYYVADYFKAFDESTFANVTSPSEKNYLIDELVKKTGIYSNATGDKVLPNYSNKAVLKKIGYKDYMKEEDLKLIDAQYIPRGEVERNGTKGRWYSFDRELSTQEMKVIVDQFKNVNFLSFKKDKDGNKYSGIYIKYKEFNKSIQPIKNVETKEA